MATEVGKAYVQIVPKTEGFKSKLTSALGGDVSSAGSDAGSAFGSNLVGKLKGIIAAAGIGTILKEALDAGGALQQSFGGLDTLYGDASQAAKDYAREAAAAGISMNDYAEQAVSFGAALKQAFAGADNAEELAANAANTAILDMADNAAKMGSDIGSIQNAYQGFAKQNYTMLDNLKLGYGGTKSEMERLLKDASKLEGAMGKTFDINNLGDVYEAIHLIQDDLGLTGVAAAEAEGTFTGSFAAMKAAATNLLADLTTGADINDDLYTLMNNAFNFVSNNLAPMVGNLLSQLPTLLDFGLSEVVRSLNIISNNSDYIVQNGVQLVLELINGVLASIPYIVEAAFNLVRSFAETIINTDWATIANEFMETFRLNMTTAAGEIFGSDGNLLEALMSWIENTLPNILNEGVEVILALVNGIISNLPEIVKTGIEVIAKLRATIASHLPQIIQSGFQILTKLIVGIINCIPDLIAALPKVIKAIVDTFGKYDWKQIGVDILRGIKNGIISTVQEVVEAAKEAASAIFESVKEFFQIGSPSKLMANEIGQWLPAGIAVGIEANTKSVEDAMNALAADTVTVAKLDFSGSNYDFGASSQGSGTVINQTLNVTTTDNSPDEIARTIRLESRYGLMVGGALG